MPPRLVLPKPRRLNAIFRGLPWRPGTVVPMLLRSFVEPDRAAVVALWHEVGLTRPWNDPGKDIDRAVSTWPDLFLIAEEGAAGGDDGGAGGGAVVGAALCGYDGHRGWIYYLAVVPSLQGRGIGRALIAEAEARL